MILMLATAAALEPCKAPSEPAAFLLTMAPSASIETTFGHSAVLVWDPRLGQRSMVFDHGHANMGDPWFAVEYAFGMAKYWGTARTLAAVKRVYARRSSPIVAQRLDMSPAQISGLVQLENQRIGRDRSFQYHWYDNNCTTRLRDGIDQAMGGALKQAMSGPSGMSIRDGVLAHSAVGPLYPVLSWGSGALASTELTDWEASYLPQTFRERIEAAGVVSDACLLLPGDRSFSGNRAPPPGWGWTLLGLGAAGAIGLASRLQRLARGLIVLFALFLAAIGTLDLLVYLLGAGEPWWSHHNQWVASPFAVFVALWALGLRWARAPGLMVVVIAVIGSVLAAVRGFPDHNLSAVVLAVPGLLASAVLLETLLPAEGSR